MDFDTLAELRHDDYVCTFPQSGEVFRGHENWKAAHIGYAERFGRSGIEHAKVRGGTQKAKVTTTASAGLPFVTSPVVQVSDTGDLVTLECSGTWPDGKEYLLVMIIEFRDGLVWRETNYFAEPFAPPEWRAEFTEPAG